MQVYNFSVSKFRVVITNISSFMQQASGDFELLHLLSF